MMLLRSESCQAAMHEIGATCHGGWGYLELEGRKLAWTHGDDKRILRDLEQSGEFDFLFYGHTHVAEQHCSGSTRIVNPGEVCGWLGGVRDMYETKHGGKRRSPAKHRILLSSPLALNSSRNLLP